MNDYFARAQVWREDDPPLAGNDGPPAADTPASGTGSTRRFVRGLLALAVICIGFGLIRAVPVVGPPMSWIALAIWVVEIIIIELYARRSA